MNVLELTLLQPLNSMHSCHFFVYPHLKTHPKTHTKGYLSTQVQYSAVYIYESNRNSGGGTLPIGRRQEPRWNIQSWLMRWIYTALFTLLVIYQRSTYTYGVDIPLSLPPPFFSFASSSFRPFSLSPFPPSAPISLRPSFSPPFPAFPFPPPFLPSVPKESYSSRCYSQTPKLLRIWEIWEINRKK